MIGILRNLSNSASLIIPNSSSSLYAICVLCGMEKGVKRKMLTSDWSGSAIQLKLKVDVNILRLTPFSVSSHP